MAARRAVLLAVAALLAAAGGGGPSLAGDTVTIDGQTKQVQGTITDLQSGDVACYLLMKDATGAEFTEMGDYSICDSAPGLIGKTVRLRYGRAQVLADECQGNPDCGKSRSVVLVELVEIVPGTGAAPE